jgi:hypothetical protein
MKLVSRLFSGAQNLEVARTSLQNIWNLDANVSYAPFTVFHGLWNYFTANTNKGSVILHIKIHFPNQMATLTDWMIGIWVQALTVPMHLGLNGPFVPHNLISIHGSPVPLLKFQMAPRPKLLMSSGSKKKEPRYKCLEWSQSFTLTQNVGQALILYSTPPTQGTIG